jgi:hypothetical protein
VTGGYFDVDTGVLRQISSDLSSAGTEVSGSASDLSVRPDAGRTSGEVGASLSTLSEAVTALGRALGEAATGVSDSADAYDRSDLNAQGNLSGPGSVPR